MDSSIIFTLAALERDPEDQGALERLGELSRTAKDGQLDALRAERLIVMQEGAGVRHVIEEELRRAGLRLHDLDSSIELGLQESVKAAVAAGYGVAFISRTAIEGELAAGTLSSARVAGLDPSRQIYVVRARSRALTRAAEAFLAFAHQRVRRDAARP